MTETPLVDVPPARVIVGTAGHIDHGKTALVRALTGVETDRLPEEKARGITIELGFAHLDSASGRRLGVIDVPGHERFVRAMVAGATGVDLVLLVVAADEGVMPQTREHLDICGLLGIERGVVALTKSDLCDPAWIQLVSDDVRAAVRGTPLDGAAIVPCSAVTGAGIDRLRAEIDRMAEQAPPRPVDGPLRLPLDRVFSMKGFGTVVTGTLSSGRVREGEDVVLLPGGARAKIRGLEVHGRPRPEALAGERAAANLQGAARDDMRRGEVLARPGELLASSVVDVELSVLSICDAPLATGTRLLFHALTTQENARVVLLEAKALAPGARGLAQVQLERPVALLPGDRFILRGFRAQPGYGTTVAGGRVVRVLAARRRRADPATAKIVSRAAAASTLEERVALEIESARHSGVNRIGLRARIGCSERSLERAVSSLAGRGAVVACGRDGGPLLGRSAVEELQSALIQAVDRFHQDEPLRPGMGREALRTSVPLTRDLDPRVFATALAGLERAGLAETSDDLVRRRGFSPGRAESERDALVARALALYEQAGLAPPWTSEVPALLGVSIIHAGEAIEILVRRGELLRVKPDLCFARGAVDDLARRLRAHLRQAGAITPQEWKELTGQSRKYAIPLAEHFDAQKLTLRVGDVRKLRSSPGDQNV